METWTTVAERMGAGWSSSMHTYDALDLFPLMGTSYYRLEQEDQDGDRAYSGIATVDFSFWQQPRAYPVPADQEVTLLGVEPEVDAFQVIDLSGRLLPVAFMIQEDRAVLNTSTLATGTYLVQWTTGTDERRSLPIVVAH
jgi:hypothetical protein